MDIKKARLFRTRLIKALYIVTILIIVAVTATSATVAVVTASAAAFLVAASAATTKRPFLEATASATAFRLRTALVNDNASAVNI